MSAEHDGAAGAVEHVKYNDAVVRAFVLATLIWGIVGMLVGVIIALQMVVPEANLGQYLTFGRLRPLHTNAVIFAFAGNAIFAAIYHSTQRLVKTRMYSDGMGWFHFWGWQGIIVSAAITLPMGLTQTKEYAELEWPIAIAIAVVWVVFAINFFMTLKHRREKHLYVAIWFYIATIVTVAVLHIVNNLVLPVGLFKSYPIYSGVQDAMIQWWYGHNAVAFFLTTPFLGLMYYYLPKAANRPVFSYRLSIVHFWSLVFIYIWAGPHHLHYTSVPEWAATLGMVFSLMLWMPSWGGMVNGLLTLRGAWHKLRTDPVLKFFVVGITFYGMATFEGPMLSIKSVNALSHYTDWTIGHVHAAALGWNGFMAFGMMYWLVPRLWKTKLYSMKLANVHFWMGTVGILVYALAMYSSGISQGLMWRAFDETGRLVYPGSEGFVETMMAIVPMYWLRLVGGLLYFASVLIGGYNFVMTLRSAPKELPDPEVKVRKPLWRQKAQREDMSGVKGWARHRLLEGWPLVFTVLTTIAILIGSVLGIAPLFLMKSAIPQIESVQPYTPLELHGRDLYIREGCVSCHSQQVRPLRAEVERYGEYHKPGEGVYEFPFLWGSKRTGPDLGRVGGQYNHLWHVRHMEDPRSTTPRSLMPPYPWLLRQEMNLRTLETRLRVLSRLGVPYDTETIENAEAIAREQARQIAEEIVDQGGPQGLEDREIVALVAYLQRLGTDIAPRAPEAPAEEAGDDTPGEEDSQ
ncbi:MAG: cytochrome-c oxidase, cbb3-type subunit I [Deltaproteobacteria bacterium]|nr:MAG: cytochrome-c oxidase, cbb3-type subunit I [Deltaproteobacteria bacterium]